MRDLYRRDLDRGLSAGEKRMLAKAKQILVSELALAERTDEEKAATSPFLSAATTFAASSRVASAENYNSIRSCYCDAILGYSKFILIRCWR